MLKKKKIVGFLVCGPGEASRYLEGTLKEFKRLCDETVVACNNVTQAELDLIDKYGFIRYNDPREWGLKQPLIKDRLLEEVGKHKPDWIIALDADEVFPPEFTREEAEKLMDSKIFGYYFYIINHWNTPDRYKKGISFWNVRFYQYTPHLGTRFLKKNVHCGLAPDYVYKYGRYAPFYLSHFGLMKAEDRAKKVERYNKYDPKADKIGIGGWYEALRDTGNGSEFNSKEMLARVREEVNKMVNNDKHFNMRPEDKIWVRVYNPKSGRSFEVQKSKVGHYKAQGCEIGEEFEVNANFSVELPVIDKVVEDMKKVVVETKQEGVNCTQCDFVAKNSTGIKRHMIKHEPKQVETISR